MLLDSTMFVCIIEFRLSRLSFSSLFQSCWHWQDMSCKIEELFKLFNQFMQTTTPQNQAQIAQATSPVSEMVDPAASSGDLLVKRFKPRRMKSQNLLVSAKVRDSLVANVFCVGASTMQDEQELSRAALDVS